MQNQRLRLLRLLITRIILLSTLYSLLSTTIIYAQEEKLTITTYYPSPYGSYNELQLYPHDSSTICSGTTQGTMYYNNTTNQIYVCNGTADGWVSVGAGYWNQSGTNLYPAKTSWTVSLGTNSPEAQLTVNSSTLAFQVTKGYSTFNDTVSIGTTRPEFKLSLDNDAGIIANGTYDSGAILTTAGAGTRLIWYPRKAAFRAGGIAGSQWDDTNIGAYSVAMGYNTTASGQNSTAMGAETVANGLASVALGYMASAPGTYSIAFGYNTNATEATSTALGYSTQAIMPTSTALGYSTQATQQYSTALGYNTIASGRYSTAIGSSINVSGDYSVGIGLDANPTTVARSNTLAIMGGNVGIATGDPGQDRLDVRGKAYCSGSWNTYFADYAEWFEKEENTEPGDLIGINLVTRKVRKYRVGDEFIGIHSASPGIVGNRLKETNEEMKQTHTLVALLGQVDLDNSGVDIQGSLVKTKDGKKIGILLSNGKVLINK